MRSSVTGRTTGALASVLLILALGACGTSEPSTGEEASSGEQQGQNTESEPSESGDRDTEAAEGGAGDDEAEEDASGTQDSRTTADGECKVEEGSSQIPTGVPEVDEWTMAGGAAAPVSVKYGPYVQDGELWTCYEHSADGALFAAAYYASAAGEVDGVYEEWLPEGELRDEIIASEEEDAQERDDSITLTHVGYRFQTYSEDSAIIDLVWEVSAPEGTAYSSLRTAFLWQDDHWVADFENFGTEARSVDSLDGYSLWRG